MTQIYRSNTSDEQIKNSNRKMSPDEIVNELKIFVRRLECNLDDDIPMSNLNADSPHAHKLLISELQNK